MFSYVYMQFFEWVLDLMITCMCDSMNSPSIQNLGRIVILIPIADNATDNTH